MTGLERLRELADDAIGSVWANTSSIYCKKHGLSVDDTGGSFSDFLRQIADQIEDEQDERVTRRLEDREAAEWVSAHGGLDAVREKWRSMVPRAHVEHMAEYQRERRERMQRHIEFVQGKCRERQERICELNRLNRAYRDALNGVCKRLGLTDGTGLPDMTEDSAIKRWNRRAERTCRVVSAKECGGVGYAPGCSECGWQMADSMWHKMRKLSGWTVLMVESEETRLRTFHRVYTWDYEKMKRTGSHECPVHPPTLILPFDTPNLYRAISAWLDIEEGPGRDFAYVREDEPDYLHIVSALSAPFGIGRHWMEHDL